MDYDRIFRSAIERLHEEGRYRVFIDVLRTRGQYPNARCFGGNGPKPITVWCSNDYLGMGQHPIVIGAMEAALRDVGAGSGGTRNISGNTHYHTELEAELASLHDKSAALLFTSGYVSNEAALSTLGKLLPGCVIFSDELNHASMIAGIKSSGCEKRVFRHNDLDHLEELLDAEDAARSRDPRPCSRRSSPPQAYRQWRVKRTSCRCSSAARSRQRRSAISCSPSTGSTSSQSISRPFPGAPSACASLQDRSIAPR